MLPNVAVAVGAAGRAAVAPASQVGVKWTLAHSCVRVVRKAVLAALVFGEDQAIFTASFPAGELDDALNVRAVESREVCVDVSEGPRIAFDQLLRVLGVDGITGFAMQPFQRKPVLTDSHSRSEALRLVVRALQGNLPIDRERRSPSVTSSAACGRRTPRYHQFWWANLLGEFAGKVAKVIRVVFGTFAGTCWIEWSNGGCGDRAR